MILKILLSVKGGRPVFSSYKRVPKRVDTNPVTSVINKSKTGCEYQFKDKNRMGLHREYFHEAVRYSCKLCEQKTEEKPNLKFHSIEVHEWERYSFLQSVRLKSRIIM